MSLNEIRQRKHRIPKGATLPPLPADIARKLVGRPTKYRDEFAVGVLEATARGYSLSAYAGSIGVDPATMREWQSSFPEFGAACARGKSARLHWWETQAIDCVKKQISGPSALIMFALKNCGPEEWREKIEVQSNHTFTLIGLIEESLAMSGRAIDVTPAKPLIDQDKSNEPDTSR